MTRMYGAVWDVELTAEEIAALEAGLLPIHIRPDHLIEWTPSSDSRLDQKARNATHDNPHGPKRR